MKTIPFIILICFLMISCEPESGSVSTRKETVITNQRPVSAVLEIRSDSIFVEDTLRITCTVVDPENDSITFEWAAFKVTDNSTDDHYELLYSLDHGEFIKAGREAMWKPGYVNGRYLILCNATDIAGYEITALKIVHINAAGSLGAKTSKVKYSTSEFSSSDTSFVSIYNYRYRVMTFDAPCERIIAGVEAKYDDGWHLIHECLLGISGSVQFDSAQSASFNIAPSLTQGHYRLLFEYYVGNLYESQKYNLYSNEFEVVE